MKTCSPSDSGEPQPEGKETRFHSDENADTTLGNNTPHIENVTTGSPVKPDRYFNPFGIKWRDLKDFFQVPEWVLKSGLSACEQLVYARLLFPLAGPNGFCRRFDQKLGIIYGLKCTDLSRHFGKNVSDYTERTIKKLASPGIAWIELQGSQGQTKNVRFLRNRKMSRKWLRACKNSLTKKPEVTRPASADLEDEENRVPTKQRKSPSVKQISEKKNLNKSGLLEPSDQPKKSGVPAKSREDADSEKRKRGFFAQPRDAIDDDLWQKLWDRCGKDVMFRCGDKWLKYFKYDRDTIATLISEFDFNERRGGTILKPGAWLQTLWNDSRAGKRFARGDLS